MRGQLAVKVNCQEHRKSMELLGLKLKLKEVSTDQKERDEIERRIMALEKDLKLD
ncbi:MAG: hypothetical protein KJ573_14165 [Proteobacteria bacterium]|nr:hypothetical protein [Desulfobacterales bacterium]MBL6967177.1 hypothetical protein [Desulfobacteraceae bacterium]MBU0732929.1 hypothetical protein [Pseudomonadota bacterium]MBL7171993.1 hypothetical protein [Desulfobacteraceae bacterium]MBU0990743.1 hypothetical protein [Pseudomonadota bacterium]